MRRVLFISTLCMLLICMLISCDMQGLVGELRDEGNGNDTVQFSGLTGVVIGTDENGNYIIRDEDGSTIVGDFTIIQGNGNQVIIGSSGGGNPEDEIDAYEVSAFQACEKPTDYIKITVRDHGEIVVRLRPQDAPITVENFKKLVDQGFYDGLVFHRIIQNFMIQGGGFDQSGAQRKTDSIKGEFSANGVDNNLEHVRGVISMARTTVPDSASSQFFICDTDSPHLDGQYAAFGYVVAGMETVDSIAAVETGYGDQPTAPVVIESITFVQQIKK